MYRFKETKAEKLQICLSKIYYSSQVIAFKVLHHSLLQQLSCLYTFTFTMTKARKSYNYYAPIVTYLCISVCVCVYVTANMDNQLV